MKTLISCDDKISPDLHIHRQKGDAHYAAMARAAYELEKDGKLKVVQTVEGDWITTEVIYTPETIVTVDEARTGLGLTLNVKSDGPVTISGLNFGRK